MSSPPCATGSSLAQHPWIYEAWSSMGFKDLGGSSPCSICSRGWNYPCSIYTFHSFPEVSLKSVDKPRDPVDNQLWTERIHFDFSLDLETLELSCCSFDTQDWIRACFELDTILPVIRRSKVKILRFELAVSPGTRRPCAGNMSLEDIADTHMREDHGSDGRYSSCPGIVESELPIELMRQCSTLIENAAKDFFDHLLVTLCGDGAWNMRGVM